MDRRDMERRRFDGYYEGSSGRKSQFELDDQDLYMDAGYQTGGKEGMWRTEPGRERFGSQHFNHGSQERGWNKHVAQYGYQGEHYGRGPKGYQRAQERIYEDVCEALSHNPHVDASNVEVSVEDGIVTLTGTVESRRMKKESERVAEQVLGVDDVINLLSMAGEAKGDQIDASGSALGGNPDQESRTGNMV